MNHRYSEAAQRIQPTNSMQMQLPKDLKELPKDPKIIRYSGGVHLASGESGGLLFKRPNLVRKYQQLFQQGNMPIFLKTKADFVIYRSLMAASLIGLGFSGYLLSKMALGTMKKSS